MSKKPDKKIPACNALHSNAGRPALVATFENILVCNNKYLRPFVEIFVFEPENMTQKNLGTLLGIFEITDDSEDSSYIVNYLSSVVKKEYFSKPKRTPIESFEAALHKANLALSKLAEHGNVKWIGKINALVAIIEKNNLHLSQTGTAYAFLMRSKGLTDISEGLSTEEAEPHPLKTFMNVSSGRLEKNDKLIITTENIFDIFSFEEIKKSALRFQGEKFIQFLKTALGNELERAAVLVCDISEKEEPPEASLPKKNKVANAFSQNAFSRAPTPNLAHNSKDMPANNGRGDVSAPSSVQNADGAGRSFEPDKNKISPEMAKEISLEIDKGKQEFTNGKNGHIYIKETLDEALNGKAPSEFFIMLGEKIGAAGKGLKKISRNSGKYLVETAKKINLPKAKSDLENETVEKPEAEVPAEIAVAQEPDLEKLAEPEEVLLLSEPQPEETTAQRTTPETGPIDAEKNQGLTFFEKLRNAAEARNNLPSDIAQTNDRPAPPINPDTDTVKEKLISALNISRNKSKKILNFVAPDFSRIRRITAKLDYQQKIYAALVLLAIIILPLLGFRLKQHFTDVQTQAVQPTAPAVLPLAADKNVTRLESLNSLYGGTGITDIINLKGGFYGISQAGIIDIANKNVIPVPQDFGRIKIAAGMDDLNLLFLLSTDGKLTAWSPVSKSYQSNTLNIPSNSNITAMGSYLTYLYLFDPKNNQIYRYPRATGGFGDKADWLKDKSDISQMTNAALSDNIFLADGSDVLKLFKGTKQSFNLETSATPIAPFKIFTKTNLTYVYILDKQNSRVIKIDPASGNIVNQFYNPEIGNANAFTVDEANNIVYIANPEAIKSFNIN